MVGELVASAFVTAGLSVPAVVPDYALRAVALYRLEVGGACFAIVYLLGIAFFLALDGRGFVEFGTRGLKAEQIVREVGDEQEVTLAEHLMSIGNTRENLRALEAALKDVIEDKAVHERRPKSPGERRSADEGAKRK
ncbi:MAG TPA: hypothetical protein VF009_09205 [Solirubrobacterales bacterium]